MPGAWFVMKSCSVVLSLISVPSIAWPKQREPTKVNFGFCGDRCAHAPRTMHVFLTGGFDGTTGVPSPGQMRDRLPSQFPM